MLGRGYYKKSLLRCVSLSLHILYFQQHDALLKAKTVTQGLTADRIVKLKTRIVETRNVIS